MAPTPAQIAQVQTNLKNMQALNDYVYNQGQSKILNAFLLLTEPDSDDPGLDIGLNILEGAFWAIGGELGPIGSFAASFMSGMVNDWATNTPPNLNATFASLLTRTQATSLQVDTQLAVYYQDPLTYWDTSFSYNGQSTTLGDLSTTQFPAETDPEFEQLAAAALLGFDQSVWQTVLVTNMVVTLWEMSSGPMILPGTESDPPVSWDESFIKQNPAYYNTWSWHESSGCGDTTGWDTNEYNLGTGAGVFHDGSISNDACAYLFIDSADGVVINKDGLYPRKTVFTLLGIKQTTYVVNDPTTPPMAAVSFAYLRAYKQQRTLSQLVAEKGEKWVKKQIRQRAEKDAVFRHNLAMRPHQTIETFLGVKIPEVLDLRVVVEHGRTFGLVIPKQEEE